MKTPRDRELEREIARIMAPIIRRICERERYARKNRAAYRKAWYQRNAAKCKANSARYRLAHPDRVKALRADWAARNPHHHRDWSRLKRARSKA